MGPLPPGLGSIKYFNISIIINMTLLHGLCSNEYLISTRSDTMPTSAIATVVSIQIITVMAINKLQINYVSILYDISMPQL